MREPVTRRQAIYLGAAGALGVVVGGAGLSQTGLPWTAPSGGGGLVGPVGTGLRQPEELVSSGGVLKVELRASRQETEIAGRRAQALTYNGTVPGPTWRVRPGDRVEVRLVNDLETPTNLHTHGWFVSPEGNSDNALLSIEPRQTFDYRFDLPTDHPAGVFWYHPHRHGLVADQMFGGLYGAIVVGDDGPAVTRERVMVVSDISLTPDGSVAPVSVPEIMMGREGEHVLVNGQLQPQITAQAGERERWRVVNACTSRYLRLAAPGQQVQLLGTDSGHQAEPAEVEEVLLAPGNRSDLLVTLRAGGGELVSRGYDRGAPMMGMMGGARDDLSGPVTLAAIEVEDSDQPAEPMTFSRPADRDLRGEEPQRRREVSFTMTMGGRRTGMSTGMMLMGFDGQEFDAERIDQDVALGAVEEWTIRNPTPMDHPFHLHVWPMQVTEVGDEVVEQPTWRDVVNVPAHSQVRVLVEFARFGGRTVYHCHILDHEDAGMMAVVRAR